MSFNISKRTASMGACQRCHDSKVKCDLKVSGPCSRCKKKNHECIPIKSRQGRYDRKKWILRHAKVSNPQQSMPSVELSELVIQRDTSRDLRCMSLADLLIQDTENSRISAEVIQDALTQSVPSELVPFTPTSPLPINLNLNVSEGGLRWISVFKSALKTNLFSKHEEVESTFLGECFPLISLSSELYSRFYIQLNSDETAHRMAHIPESLFNFLDSNGSFELPDEKVFETLINCYFQNIHPFYPIINKSWFMDVYSKGNVPWLLLHAMCFAACYYCSESVFLQNLGSRAEAKATFYQRAKQLFDANYERKRVIVVQSTFLLSFWGGGPNDIWNPYMWLSTAVTIAQTLGMHRSRGKNQSDAQTKMIWWCLCNRDIFFSISLGQPPRISLRQCDVESISLGDHSDDLLHQLYLIEVSKLGIFLRAAIQARFDPRAPRSSAINNKLYDCVVQWRKSLPRSLDWESSNELPSTCLNLLYSYVVIFIYRPRQSSLGLNKDDPSTAILLESVSQIVNTGSQLILKAMISKLPQDVYPSFFMAMVILAIQSRSPDKIAADFANVRLELCKMVLHQANGYWDHASWVVEVFGQLPKSKVAEDDRGQSDILDGDLCSVSEMLESWLDDDFLHWEFESLIRN